MISPGGADTVSVVPCSGYDKVFTNACHLLLQTVAGLECFFLAMTLHIEEQKKAQAEIDNVIGLGRLPTLRDRECLPYTSALLTEVQRRYNFAMLGSVSFLLCMAGFSLGKYKSRCSSCLERGRCSRGILHPERLSCHGECVVSLTNSVNCSVHA